MFSRCAWVLVGIALLIGTPDAGTAQDLTPMSLGLRGRIPFVSVVGSGTWKETGHSASLRVAFAKYIRSWIERDSPQTTSRFNPFGIQ